MPRKCYWLRLGNFVFLQFLLIFIVIILSRKSFATTRVSQRPSCSPTVLSSVESNAVSSPGRKAILVSTESKVIPSTSSNNGQRTNLAKTIKKPVIDMVNDYEPFIDFKFVFPEIMPLGKNHSDIFLVVLVNSGAMGDEHRKRRGKIRQTWGNVKNCEQLGGMNNPKLGNLKWILVFVLGKVGGMTKDDELNAAESKQFNDILIGNISDNYLNNIIKFYMAQLWASTLTAKYTLKTDDDVYVRIPIVIQYIVNKNFPSRFYGGTLNPGSPVRRHANGKWSISKKYFAETFWPPYHLGAFVVISTDLQRSLFNYVYIRKPFHVDDAYIGIAMRYLKVKVTEIKSFRLIKDKMREVLPQMTNCEILDNIAFGDNIGLEQMNALSHVLELMCSKDINGTSCKTFKL